MQPIRIPAAEPEEPGRTASGKRREPQGSATPRSGNSKRQLVSQLETIEKEINQVKRREREREREREKGFVYLGIHLKEEKKERRLRPRFLQWF